MARVYRAYHPQLDRYVAVKVLRSDLVEEEEFLARFRREAQAVAGLRHTNIIQIFDFDFQDEIYYIIMELLTGDTLKARLNDYRIREQQMAWGEMVRVLLDVLDALAYAHGEGIIHRDIKPANIMLTSRGQAVVADFGIAQIIGGTQHTAAGMLMGTLNYMAPEQGLEGRSDARSDLYSVGIIFYEMLTRQKPFDADTPLAILMKHLQDPLPLPCQIEPTVPQRFERVVLKALAKQPQDRYQSAAEMSQALLEAVEEARVELPDRISPPLSFTTSETPSESVAVLSGTAREKIADAQFAKDETDANLGQRLAAERAARKSSAKDKRPAGSIPPVEDATPATAIIVILKTFGFLVLANLLAVTIFLLTDKESVYSSGWPANILLLSWGLSRMMSTSGSIKLLAPLGFIFTNSVFLTYSALTDHWEAWEVFWVLELWLIIGLVALIFRLAGREERARRFSRRLGNVLARISMGLAFIVIFAAAVFG
jgi:serine/threonine protein kinase